MAEEEAAAEIAAPARLSERRDQAQHPQAGPPAVAGEPAARAHRLPGALHLPQVRRPGPQAGRGRHRDARVRAAALEGGRARAREGLLPRVRGGQPAAGALAPDRPWASRPDLLALVLAAKYGQHLPLTRQSAIYAREGVEIDVSTLADWVGAAAASSDADGARQSGRTSSRPSGCTATTPRCRCWPRSGPGSAACGCYVRDDRPFAGPDSAGSGVLLLARSRGQHPERHLAGFTGILQADAYGRVQPALRARSRKPGPILEAACWAHARRKLYELAATRRRRSRPRRCGASIGCSRSSATSPAERRGSGWRYGEERSAPILAELEPWLRPAGAALAQVGGRQGDRLHDSSAGKRSPGS